MKHQSRKKWMAMLLVLTLCAGVLAGCGSPKQETPAQTAPADKPAESAAPAAAPEKPSDTSPIVIGSIQDLSGTAADAGVSSLWGAEYAIKAINENGGINGRELQLISMDCGGDVQQAINCYRKLVDEDKVCAIIGPSLSNVGIALAPLTTEDGVPMIGHYIDESATTNPETGEAFPFMFLACPGNNVQSYCLAKYCMDVLGLKSFSALYNEANAFSVKLVGSLLEYVEAHGGEVISPETFTFGDQDYRAQAVKLANAAPDAIMSPNYTYFDALVYSQLREAGFEGTFIGPNTIAPPFPFMTTAEVKDVYYLINVDMVNGQCVDLLETYEKDTGDSKKWNVCFGYDIVKILEACLAQVDDVHDGAALADAIAHSSVDTISGTITMNPETHRPEGMSMFIAKYDENKQMQILAEVWAEEDVNGESKLVPMS